MRPSPTLALGAYCRRLAPIQMVNHKGGCEEEAPPGESEMALRSWTCRDRRSKAREEH